MMHTASFRKAMIVSARIYQHGESVSSMLISALLKLELPWQLGVATVWIEQPPDAWRQSGRWLKKNFRQDDG